MGKIRICLIKLQYISYEKLNTVLKLSFDFPAKYGSR